MKVLLGVDSIRYPLTGIGTYAMQLCKAYLANPDIELQGISKFSLLSNDKLLRLIAQLERDLLTQDEPVSASNGAKRKHNIRQKIRGVPLSQWGYQAVSAYRSKANLHGFGDDTIHHSPNFIGHPSSCKKVITVHDLSHLAFPQYHPKDRVKYLHKRLASSIDQADHIIVDSDFTRDSMIELGLVHSSQAAKVTTIHLGVDRSFQKVSATVAQQALTEINLSYKAFILSIGTLEPRKNLVRLIQAYQALPAALAEGFPLVIAGGKGWKYNSILDAVKNIKAPHRVILLGYVPTKQMIEVLSSAKCFVYPSLYEGFGLPILEAMKCEVPVITSNDGALKEVAGNGALLCDVYDVDSIADCLRQVLESEELCKSLVARGKEQVTNFSWGKCSENTIKVYRGVVA
jgi:glycosyltransferase involved in cell wall biosynthesis